MQQYEVIVSGKQVAHKRINIVNRAVTLFLNKSEEVDWESYDMLISIIPKIKPEENNND
jgi:hypothetical protein